MPALILMVNGDARLGIPLRLLLEGEGHAVSLANHGQAARTLLETDRPALILVNVSLPDIGGFELCQAVREHPEWRRIPLLLIGSQAGEIVTAQAKALGADAYLGIPFSNSSLCDTIGILLGGISP